MFRSWRVIRAASKRPHRDNWLSEAPSAIKMAVSSWPQLVPNRGPESLAKLGGARGVLTVSMDGSLGSTLEGRLALEAAGLNWVVDGKADWREKGFDLNGRTAFRAPDIATGLMLAGLSNSGLGRRSPPSISMHVWSRRGLFMKFRN